MFSKQMFYVELHPHIPEIHTKILVNKKGLFKNHIKAPAIVKVEFHDL